MLMCWAELSWWLKEEAALSPGPGGRWRVDRRHLRGSGAGMLSPRVSGGWLLVLNL